MNWRLNKTEVKLLSLLATRRMTVSEIAKALDRSLSWTSECVAHLNELGFFDVERKGNRVSVSMSANALGKAATLLMVDEPMLSLDAVLTGPGLKMLPLVLGPGHKAKDISSRSGLSIATVKTRLSRWRKMGLVGIDDRRYHLRSRYERVTEFAMAFFEHRNSAFLKKTFPEAIIIWQWQDEFMFNIERSVEDKRFRAAGPTRLDELDYDILSVSECYFYSPDNKEVSEAEALVQTVRFDPNNPRIKRLFKFDKNDIDYEKLFEYASKYGLKTSVKEIVMTDDRKEKIRKE